MIIIIILGYLFFSESSVELKPGIKVFKQPLQTSPSIEIFKFTREGKTYIIEPIKDYNITAKILSIRSYKGKKDGELSPIDLSLGWDMMSNQMVVNTIEIWQSGRWYRYKTTENSMASLKEINKNSSNTHIIPDNEEIMSKIENMKKGQIINLKGYLVKVDMPNGGIWNSSTRRNDSGNGACELMYVEEVSIIE